MIISCYHNFASNSSCFRQDWAVIWVSVGFLDISIRWWLRDIFMAWWVPVQSVHNDSSQLTHQRTDVFLLPRSLHGSHGTRAIPWYNWNIVECGVKHHNRNQTKANHSIQYAHKLIKYSNVRTMQFRAHQKIKGAHDLNIIHPDMNAVRTHNLSGDRPGSCKSNYHMVTITTPPYSYLVRELFLFDVCIILSGLCIIFILYKIFKLNI
jgi:hypothetical protein